MVMIHGVQGKINWNDIHNNGAPINLHRHGWGSFATAMNNFKLQFCICNRRTKLLHDFVTLIKLSSDIIIITIIIVFFFIYFFSRVVKYPCKCQLILQISYDKILYPYNIMPCMHEASVFQRSRQNMSALFITQNIINFMVFVF